MHLNKVLILLAAALLFANARVLRKKVCKRINPSCGCPTPLIEPTYGCFGTCSCQNLYLDETSNSCGCQFVNTYGVLNPELPSIGRMSAVRLPKTPVAFEMSDDSYEILPAINLPGLCDCLNELPCSCQTAVQYVETPCGCQMCPLKRPIESSMQAPLYLPQVLPLSSCGCQNMPCSCQNIQCGCQNMRCGCQNMPCDCPNTRCGCTTPCSCQSLTCGCQNIPCGCQSRSCGCQRVCGCQNMLCGCQNAPCASQNCKCQNALQYGLQLPALELPCACQACQLSPVELPVCGCGCQSLSLSGIGCGCQALPAPVVGCGGKYLRQVIIQPPFL